jgi:hypothetical protein
LTPPDPQLKGAWYPGGFKPCTYQVKNRYQNVPFKCNLHRYRKDDAQAMEAARSSGVFFHKAVTPGLFEAKEGGAGARRMLLGRKGKGVKAKAPPPGVAVGLAEKTAEDFCTAADPAV